MDSTSTIRLGIIGLGNIAKQHISLIQNQKAGRCILSAVCNRSGEQFAKSLGVPHFVDYQELFDSGVCDAVLIATPTFNHFAIGAAALKAGLHILMEKPIGLSVLEGERLLALQGNSTVFALMLNQRTDPLFTTMHELLQKNSLGRLVRCSWTMTNWFRPEVYFQVSEWRATWKGEGGGLLVNQCIHNLDIFQWLVGMPASLRASCAFGKYHDIEVEDEVTCFLNFDKGATGTFIGSTGEAPGANRLEIVGDKGYLYFDGQCLFHGVNDSSTREYSHSTNDMFGVPNTTVTDITPTRELNQHALVIANFCEAILNNSPLVAPAAEGLNSLALANAMLLSTWSDTEVSLPINSQDYQDALNERITQSGFREKADIDVNIDISKSFR